MRHVSPFLSAAALVVVLAASGFGTVEASAARGPLGAPVAAATLSSAPAETLRTTVSSGVLSLGFTPRRGHPWLSGLVRRPVDPPKGVTAPAPAPVTAPGGAASWRAPALVNPIVWTPSASTRTLKAPPDRDVLVRWPSTPLDVVGGFELNGGRNIVSIGGTIKFSKRHFPAGADQANNNRCLYITGNATAQKPRTVHVEGLHCAGAYVWEGINIDSKKEKGSLTVQLRDITVDGVNVDLPGGTGKHYGGDALQVWNGPHRLRVDGFDARKLEYQGCFLQPNQFGTGALGQWELNDVYLEGASTGSGYLLWLAGERTGSSAIRIAVTDVWVKPSPGKSPAKTLWDHSKDWQDVQIGTP